MDDVQTVGSCMHTCTHTFRYVNEHYSIGSNIRWTSVHNISRISGDRGGMCRPSQSLEFSAFTRRRTVRHTSATTFLCVFFAKAV